MELIESQRREIDHTIAGNEQLRRDQPLLHEQLSEQNRDLVKLISNFSMRWKNYLQFKSQESMILREED